MLKPNRIRIILAGIVAGMVFNTGGMLSAWIIDLPASFAQFGVEPRLSAAFLHMSLRFGLGIASMILYAVVQPGMDKPSKTVFFVGCIIWFVAYVPGSVLLGELGVLTPFQLYFAIAWGIPEAVGATYLGAKLYRRLSDASAK